MNDQYEPEIGQAVFGACYSEYSCPEYIEALLAYLAGEIERVEWNIRQQDYEAPTKNVGGEYLTDVFEMYSYYWGNCTCGFEGIENFNEIHGTECYQTKLREAKLKEGWLPDDFWGEVEPDAWSWDLRCKKEDAIYKRLTKEFQLPMMGCAVHCTCDYEDRYLNYLKIKGYPDGHKKECLLGRPNFKCGDFEVRWYKYLGRGMSMNKQITEKEARQIFDKCLASVREKDKVIQ